MRQPEGRGRQDHDRRQPRRLPGDGHTVRPRGRSRPPGQRNERARRRQVGRRPLHLRRALRRRCRPTSSSCGRPSSGSISSRRRYRWRGPRSSWRRWPNESAGWSASLEPLTERYDHILIDCPPTLGLLTVNALTAAGSVLVPLQCEYYALEGLSQLLATINLVRDHLNPELAIRGVVLTMFDSRTFLSAEVRRRGASPPRRLGLRHDHPAQRPPVRGAQLRRPDRDLPAGLEGRGGVRGPRARVHRQAAPAPGSRHGHRHRHRRPACRRSVRCHRERPAERPGTWPRIADPLGYGRDGRACGNPAGPDPRKSVPAPQGDRRRSAAGPGGQHRRARRAPADPRERDAGRI